MHRVSLDYWSKVDPTMLSEDLDDLQRHPRFGRPCGVESIAVRIQINRRRPCVLAWLCSAALWAINVAPEELVYPRLAPCLGGWVDFHQAFQNAHQALCTLGMDRYPVHHVGSVVEEHPVWWFDPNDGNFTRLTEECGAGCCAWLGCYRWMRHHGLKMSLARRYALRSPPAIWPNSDTSLHGLDLCAGHLPLRKTLIRPTRPNPAATMAS